MTRTLVVLLTLVLSGSPARSDSCQRFRAYGLRPGMSVARAFAVVPPNHAIRPSGRDIHLQPWWSVPPFETIWIAAHDDVVTEVIVERGADPGFLLDLVQDWNHAPDRAHRGLFSEEYEWEPEACGIVARVAMLENRMIVVLRSEPATEESP